MALLTRLSSLWRNLFRKTRAEQELKEEVDAYLEMLIVTRIEQGIHPAEARRQALIEMGGVEQVKERVREVRMGHHLETLWQDVRYAVRGMSKHALLSIIVIATLTLGIGVSAGVFTYYNAEFLRAKLDKDFDSFARIYVGYTKDPTRPGRLEAVTLEDYLAFRDGAKSLRNLAAYADFYASLGKDDPVEARALLVTSNFFSLYDLEQPFMGRLLQPEDNVATNPVVVLSERLWRNRFEADPQIVGKVVHFNGQPVTVVGVAPTFAGMINGAGAWLPYTLETYLKRGEDLQKPGEAAWLKVAGRLNPGFSHRDAATELKLLASQQDRLHPGRTTTLTVTDGSWIQEPEDRGKIMLVFAVILGALIFFVMIMCVNVTTLLLARAAARRQEIAVRLALGAGKARLIRMLLIETFLLAAVAGLAGFYTTWRIPDILDHWLTGPGGSAVYSRAPDWRVFGYLALVTILAGAMAGLTPALQSLKVNLSEMIKGSQSMPGGGKGSWFYGLLIGAQVALSFFLLYGAGLFVSVAQKAVSYDPGFETRQTLEAGLFVQRAGVEPRNWDDLYRALNDRITALPGVQSIAYSYSYAYRRPLIADVQTPGQALRQVGINPVSSNYFTTLGIPIVSGRAIRDDDPPCEMASGRTMCAVVVSQRLTHEFWPKGNPLGQTLIDRAGNSYEVVGVARDISSTRLGGWDEPMIYKPLSLNNAYPPHPFVRFSGEGASLARAITAAARELAPELVVRVKTIESMREELTEGIWRQTRLIVFLCIMAVGLAVIGIYGVVAFAVSQRTKEMGIRIALGAHSKDIYRAVLGSSGRPIAIGLLIGLAITVATCSAVAPLLRDVEFAVNALDPGAYAMTAVLLAGVALAAMLIPARRATRVDPMSVLRDE